MIYGAINARGEAWYADLKRVFAALGQCQRGYNWLITDCICYPQNPETAAMLRQPYCWLSGQTLTDLLERENVQWIWACLCAFDRSVTLEQVLQHPLPKAEDCDAIWQLPLTMQHPLSKLELVAVDSSMTLLLSRNGEIVESFRRYFPQSEELGDYIGRS